jgi:hypothetical protein
MTDPPAGLNAGRPGDDARERDEPNGIDDGLDRVPPF